VRESVRAFLQRRSRALLLILPLAFFFFRAELGIQSYAGKDGLVEKNFVAAGEALIHRLPSGSVPARMPVFSITAAALMNHVSLPRRQAFVLVHLLIALGFLGSVYLLVGSYGLAAPAALVLLTAASAELFTSPYYGGIHAFAVLVVAYAWIRRETEPGLRPVVLLALAIGASFFVRSFLLALPLVVFARECLRSGRARDAAILLLVPYAMLLPRIFLYWTLDSRLLLFEDDGPYHGPIANLVMAVVGLIQCCEGDFRPLMQLGPDGAAWPYLWVAAEVARHPFVYLSGVARRVLLVASWHPWLVLAAGAGLARRWKEPAFQAMGLLAGYFLLVHALMSIQPSYFTALWPVLALLAAGAWPGRRKPGAEDLRLGAATGALAFAVLVALCVYAGWRVLAYARVDFWGDPGRVERRVDSLLLSHPLDPWLLAKKAQARMLVQDWRSAALHLGQAARLQPRYYRLDWARAAMYAGDPGPLRAIDETDPPDFPAACAKVSALLHGRRPTEAKKQLLTAFELFDRTWIMFRDPESKALANARALMRGNRSAFVESVWSLESLGPPRNALALTSLLLDLAPSARWLWLERARLAEKVGERRLALASLAAAARLAPPQATAETGSRRP
jgi:hypothetical protein